MLRRVFQQTIVKGFSGIEFLIPLFLLWPLQYYTVGVELIISIFIAVVFYLISELFSKSFLLKSIYQAISVFTIVWVFGIAPAILLGIVYFPKRLETLKQAKIVLAYLLLLLLLGATSLFQLGANILKVQLAQFTVFTPTSIYPGFWIFCLLLVLFIVLGYIPKIKLININNLKSAHWKFLFSFPTIIILVSILIISVLFRNPEKYKAKIDIHILNKEWDKALSYTDKIDVQDREARFQLNRALYVKGKMSADLFSISQDWGEYGLLLSKELSMESMPYLSDLFFDLAYIKASKYCMLEYQTASPYAPRSLERLATTSLILGEIPTCSKYFTILSKSIIYGDKYAKLLDKLNKQPYLLMSESTPKNIAILKGDEIINLKEPDIDLYNILEVSPQNKMAFEYLMSYYILRNDLDAFYNLLPMAIRSGYYIKMPKTWEEAVILYNFENSLPLDSAEFKINAQNIERFMEFRNIYVKNNTSVQLLKEALQPDFKTSFWYYRYFDNPNLGKQLKKSK